MKKALVSASAAALLVLSLGLSKASHAKPAAGDQNGSIDQYQIKIEIAIPGKREAIGFNQALEILSRLDRAVVKNVGSVEAKFF